jgi:hypothetical protein
MSALKLSSGNARFILALALLMLAGAGLVIGMWQAPPLQRPMSAASGSSKSVMSDAWIGLIGTLLGVVVGAVTGFVGAWLLKYWDDRRKRQTLATGLLSEIRLLHLGLRNLHDDMTAACRVMEPFQTAMYDQAGANLLLFKPKTMHDLNVFYNGVHELQAMFARYRLQYPDPQDLAQRYPPGDREHTYVRIMATSVDDAVLDVAKRLRWKEGGQPPGKLPLPRHYFKGSQLEVPELKPSIFESWDDCR